MGTGYTRNDTSNNIADANVIDASDLDGEFDAIESAFVAATGHTHDGTSAEGGAVTVVGPAQEYIAGGSDFTPKTDDTYDLGSASLQWKDLYVDGVSYLDEVDIDAGSIDGTIIGASTPAAITGTIITATTVEPTGDTSSGDSAAIGYTASEGLILTGQGSSYDVTIKNDADTVVATVPTGTTNWDVVGNIVVGGTVDGRNVASDGSKLDGIESSADVTDTANVTSAGALMDSEVASLSGVKTLTVPDSTTISSFGATLVDDANAGAAQTTLGLVPGTDVQAQDAGLQAIADATITGVTGSDADVVTGTAGTASNLVEWDANGDAIDSGFAVLDEDDMASDSATDLATQQSIKRYVTSYRGAPAWVIADHKTSGTAGGTATAGARRTRDLNTEVYDPDNLVSISSNQFTSTVDGWVEWEAPAIAVGLHKTWLQNITDATTDGIGRNAHGATGVSAMTSSVGGGPVIAGKAYEIQHQVNTTNGTNGFGLAGNFDTEVYTRVRFWRT